MRCLVMEFGADVNIAATDGSTPLMVAAEHKHTDIVVWLTKHGANSQASHPRIGTAADISKANGASAEQTAYLEVRAHCAKPGCEGAGLKTCRLPRHILLWQGVPGGALVNAQGRVRAERGKGGRQEELRSTQQMVDLVSGRVVN
jgi:hypothetical protein